MPVVRVLFDSGDPDFELNSIPSAFILRPADISNGAIVRCRIRTRMQIDIGFGDVANLGLIETEYPRLWNFQLPMHSGLFERDSRC